MRRTVPAASLALLILLLASLPAFAQVTVSTFAGIPAVRGLAMDASGRLYASSRGVVSGGPSGQHNIRRYSPPSNAATVFASSADGLDDPIDMAFDNAGNLIVADFVHMIHSITPSGVASVLTTASNPGAVTRDAAGNIYVGEYATRRILRIAPDGTVSIYVTQVWPEAGSRLTMLYADPDGSLYAGDLNPGRIWKIGPGGSPITLFATGLGSVVGMASWVQGGWIVSTYDDHTLRVVNPDGSHFLYAGATDVPGTTDGPPATARFSFPSSVLYSPVEKRYYIADYGNGSVRVLDVADIVTSVQRTSWGRVKSLYRDTTAR